jgi:putative flippase GtrA
MLNFAYLRYLLVAAISALSNNVILILGDRLGYGYGILVFISSIFTGSMAYLLHSRVTFRRRMGWPQYVRFMIGIALGTPVALAFIGVLRDVVGLEMPLAAPIATALMVVYNYISARLAIMPLPIWTRKRGHPGNVCVPKNI